MRSQLAESLWSISVGISFNIYSVSGGSLATSLNSHDSSSIYFSPNISTLQIAVFVLGNLF